MLAPVRRLTRLAALGGVALTAVAFGLGLVMTRGILGPIRALGTVADAIARGEPARVLSERQDELGGFRGPPDRHERGAGEEQDRAGGAAPRAGSGRARGARGPHAGGGRARPPERDRRAGHRPLRRPGHRLALHLRQPDGRRPAGPGALDLVGKHIWTEFPEGKGQLFHLAYERAAREQTPVTLQEHYPPWDRSFDPRTYPRCAGSPSLPPRSRSASAGAAPGGGRVAAARGRRPGGDRALDLRRRVEPRGGLAPDVRVRRLRAGGAAGVASTPGPRGSTRTTSARSPSAFRWASLPVLPASRPASGSTFATATPTARSAGSRSTPGLCATRAAGPCGSSPWPWT